MAKKEVVEIVCDRCERVEYIDPKEVRDNPDLRIALGFEVQRGEDNLPAPSAAQFNELCSSCRKTVKNLFEQMTKKINWKRGKGENGETDS